MEELKRRNKRKPIMNRGIPWTPYQKRMAQNMGRIMAEKGITKTGLSAETGICFETIVSYLHAETASPSLKHISSIARGLGVEIKDLLK